MAKNVKTVSDNCDFGEYHIRWNTVLKVTDSDDPKFNMLFKIAIDVRNGANDWNICVWSPATYTWNNFATQHDISDITTFDFASCREFGSVLYINPQAKTNHQLMVDYIVNFCNEL